MKLLIISDTHSNIDALRAIWEKENDSDYIIFAGDMVDCGFNPEETVEWFMQRRDILFAVKGNHDDLILSRRNDPQKSVFENHQDYTLSKISEKQLDFIASLPRELTFNLDGRDFYVCHMIYDFPEDIYYVEKQIVQCNTYKFLNEQFANGGADLSAKERVAVYGHSHLQWVAAAGQNGLIINPGSVSHKFNCEPAGVADYIIFEDGNVSLRHANYETQHLYEKAEIFSNPEDVSILKKIFKK